MTPEEILAVHNRGTCLYPEPEVEAALDRMAVEITRRLAGTNPIILSVMHGAVIVTGKLATRLNFPLRMDYIHATRYQYQTRGSQLRWKRTPDIDPEGQIILVVDDILDEGDTMSEITGYLRGRGARETLVAVLLDKEHTGRTADMQADFVGLRVGNHYVYGYGMDYKGYLRNCNGIYRVNPADQI